MSKPIFRPIAPLDVDDGQLDQINERLGVPVMVRPQATTPQRATVAPSRRAATPSRRQQKLTVRVPVDVIDAMKRRALDQHTTVRHLVLLALQKDGYAVLPSDLLPGAGGSD